MEDTSQTIPITCDKCRKVIVKIDIYPDGEKDERPLLKLTNENWLCGSEIYSLDKDALLRLQALLSNNQFSEAAQKDREAFGFFCTVCTKNYCIECWENVTEVLDGGFYDYAWANCPAGHKQDIND